MSFENESCVICVKNEVMGLGGERLNLVWFGNS